MKIKFLAVVVTLMTTVIGHPQIIQPENVEIQGELKVSGNLGGKGISIESTSGAGLILDRAGIHNNAHVRFANSGTIFSGFGADNDGTNNLYWGTGGFAQKFLTLKEGGNIGIGTTNPQKALHIVGENTGTVEGLIKTQTNNNAGAAGVTAENNQGGYLQMISWGSSFQGSSLGELRANNSILEHSGTGNLFLGTRLNSDMGIVTNSQRRLTIKSDGKIGIGTNSPGAGLAVNHSSMVLGAEGVSGNFSEGTTVFEMISPTRSYLSMRGGEGAQLYISSRESGSSFFFVGQPFSIETYDGATKTAFYAALDGKVGIGTINPTEQLSVNGKIHAEEIIVEPDAWPDYVFYEDYGLQSLNEIESYIKEQGHLPNVPSAKEVDENGITLGKMNALLLEKIEELTLHLIQMEKNQNIVIQALEERIKELENDL